MKLFRLFSIFVALAMVLNLVTTPALAQAPQAETPQAVIEKIEADLMGKLSTGGSADFIVLFTEQADLSPANSMSWEERGEFVYSALKDTADKSQAPAKELLEKQGLMYESYFVGNEMLVRAGTQVTAEALSALPEVGYIRATRTYYIDPVKNALNSLDVPVSKQQPDATMDWGIIDTKADQFWSNFGYQGEGIVVANIDTGVQYDHPALDQSFKCASPTDPACWNDPANVCGAGGACDNNGHGTHTMGTMIGDDDDTLQYIVGMAPDAQWIACKGCETTSCSDASLNACADWIVAPNGDPANRPNIVNNSWGGGGGDPWYLSKVSAWRAAGVFPAFSAGNNYNCSSLGSPGDYQESFATAAHDINRNIAGFSSKGPSPYGHDPYTKPNISAPGVDICSSYMGGGWNCTADGTSMASPHTAGAVALLWSCNPSLVGNIDATFQILQETADPALVGACGAPPDGEGNYTYGYGYLNMLAIGQQYCVSGWGAIQGHVYNAVTSAPISEAVVTGYRDAGGSWEDDTDVTGYYTMTVGAGTYTVDAVHPQFTTASVAGLEVLTGTLVTQDLYLQPRAHLYGFVTDQDSGAPLEAVVNVTGGPTTTTDPGTGAYEFYLDAGTYEVTASAVDYADEVANVTLSIGEQEQHDFTLLAAIAVVPDPIAISLEMGQTGAVASTITNNMAVPYGFEFKEKAGQPGRLAGEDILVVRHDATAAAAMELALTTLGYTFLEVTDAQFQAMTVPDLLAYSAVFHAGTTLSSNSSEALLMAYLDAGGSLYISDNDLGYQRHGSLFYDTYLQSTYNVDNGGTLLTGEEMMLGLNPDVTTDPYPDNFTVGAEGTRLFKWSDSDYAGGVLVERNGYTAIYTSFDFQQIADVADETELINRIAGMFVNTDVSWYETSITDGTVPAGGTLPWTNTFYATTAAGIGQPGDYYAMLKVDPTDATQPDKQVPVHMTVLPSANFGQIVGTVTSDRPGGPLVADILIEASDGVTVTLTTDPLTGAYSYWFEQGSYTVTAASAGYVSDTAAVTVVGQQVTPQDFELALDEPEIVVTPTTLVETLQFGQSSTQLLNIANVGLQPLTWELLEANAGQVQVNNILLMADDVAAADWDVYRAALTAAGASWDEWNLDTLSFPTAADLAPYGVLIWADENTVIAGDAECQIVADWLAIGGKSLFATGIDFIWDLANGTIGGGEHNLYLLFNTAFQGDYAGAAIATLDGVPGDPLGGSFAAPNGLTLAATADSNGDYANLASVAVTGAIYGAGGTGSGYAGLTHYEGANYTIAWLGVNFHNGLTNATQREVLMSNVLSLMGGSGDVPWLSETPTSGSLEPEANVDVTVGFDTTMVPEPGVYQAVLRAMSNDPLNPMVDIPVTLNVLPSGDIGKVEGVVTSDRPGGPLEADVLIESSYGMTWTIPTDPATGYYYKWLVAGDYAATFSAVDYAPQTIDFTITGQVTTTLNAELILLAPEIAVDPASLSETLQMGQTADQTLNISNLGNVPLTFEITERNGDFTPAMAGEDILVVRHDATAAGVMETALTTLGYTFLEVTDAQFQAMTVDQLLEFQAVFHAGVTGTSATPGPSELLLIQYLDAGGSLYISDNDLGYYRDPGDFYNTYLQAVYIADNGGDYIDGLDIMSGLTLDITADPYPDSFSVNAEGTPIFQFQGASNYNGVAVARGGYRAVYTGFDFQNINDPALEVEIINRVLGFIAASEIPWLSEEPITGTVAAGGTAAVVVTFDAGAADEPGVYTAFLRIAHNDPLQGAVTVPITLTVEPSPDYGRLEGIVNSLGYCDGAIVPLEAEILIEAEDGSSWTVTSDPTTGEYFRWLLAGTYTVTASAELHLPVTAVVDVTATQVTLQDFDLRLIESCMDVSPLSFSLTLPVNSQQTEQLTIDNLGAGELIWEMHETTRTIGASGISIPRFTGTLPDDKTPVSVGRAPAGLPSSPAAGVPVLNPGEPGYTMDLMDDSLYHIPDLDFPATWSLVSSGVTSAYAGDFGPDTDTEYMISQDTLSLYAVDVATGAATLIGPSDPGGGRTLTGMAWDPTSQTMYVSATDGATAQLYTLNLTSGTLTLVTPVSGAPYLIDIAVDETGQMWGVDISLDSLLSIDKATGATTVIGSIGFTANYAQGMDYDLENHILYLAGYNYNGVSGTGELRIVDRTTGNTSLVGTFPDGDEVDAFAVEAGGIPPWNEVPWVSEDPILGVVAGDSSVDVAVTFDTTGLIPGECYTANLGLIHDDPGQDSPLYIPLELCVSADVPDITVTPASIALTLESGQTQSVELVIGNAGIADLTVTAISEDGDFMTLSGLPVLPAVLVPDGSVTFAADLSAVGLAAGEYTATITIASDDPDEPVVTVTVTLTVTEPSVYRLYLPIVMKH